MSNLSLARMDRAIACLFFRALVGAVVVIAAHPAAFADEPATSASDQTQRVRELIYVLRQYRTGSRCDEWGGAIRELAIIGKPAVPELVAELDRTDRDQTLRALGFTLRAIGDPRAAPALIRAIPKALRPPGSDFGLNFDDPDVRVFVEQVREVLDRYSAQNSPVVQMQGTNRPTGQLNTYAFKTREGSVGLLQFKDADRDGRVTIRYQLHRGN